MEPVQVPGIAEAKPLPKPVAYYALVQQVSRVAVANQQGIMPLYFINAHPCGWALDQTAGTGVHHIILFFSQVPLEIAQVAEKSGLHPVVRGVPRELVPEGEVRHQGFTSQVSKK